MKCKKCNFPGNIILRIVEIKAHESQCLFIHVLDLRIALKHAPYEVHGVIDTLKNKPYFIAALHGMGLESGHYLPCNVHKSSGDCGTCFCNLLLDPSLLDLPRNVSHSAFYTHFLRPLVWKIEISPLISLDPACHVRLTNI